MAVDNSNIRHQETPLGKPGSGNRQHPKGFFCLRPCLRGGALSQLEIWKTKGKGRGNVIDAKQAFQATPNLWGLGDERPGGTVVEGVG